MTDISGSLMYSQSNNNSTKTQHNCITYEECCFRIIGNDKVEHCDVCYIIWSRTGNNITKKYFETTFNLCDDCLIHISCMSILNGFTRNVY